MIFFCSLPHCHWDHVSQVPNDRICRLPSTVGKNCLPCTHTHTTHCEISRGFLCLSENNATHQFGLMDWKNLAGFLLHSKNTSRVNFFSQALYMTNAEIAFQPKTRMVNLSCKLSIIAALWLEMTWNDIQANSFTVAVYKPNTQSNYKFIKIPSGLGNHIQLSFTESSPHPPLEPQIYMAFGRFNSAEGLPFGIFESMKPTRKIGSRHNFFPMTDPWDW